MKEILFTTLLIAGVVCLAFGIHANAITMTMLGCFLLGVYNRIINMKE